MEDEYNDSQDSLNDGNRNNSDGNDSGGEAPKDFGDGFGGYDDGYDDEDGGNGGRNGRNGRGNFRGRGRGPPPGWMNGPPPMRFRGRGYGPGGPPMRGRGFFRGRGGPRFNNGPNFDNNWGPMGPPPPGMMGGPPPFGPPPGMMGPGGPMGPPPNMMGQPPPFGGPPGMPPPNMPGPELWVETKSEDGKSYYYHARTRETTWTRPQESPTCKVITQPDMEAMAASGQLPGMGAPQQMPMNAGPIGGPMGMMPPGVAPPTSGTGPPFMQPPPWANKPDNDISTEFFDQDMRFEINDGPTDGENKGFIIQGPPRHTMPYVPWGNNPERASEDGIPSLFSKETMPPFMQPPPWANQSDDGQKDGNHSDNESNDAPPGESVTTLPPQQQPPNTGFPGQPGGGQAPGPTGPWSGWPGAPGGVPGGAGWPPPLTGQPPPLLGNAPQQQGNQLPPPMGAMGQQATSTGTIQMKIPTSLPQAQPQLAVPGQIGVAQPPMGNMGAGQPPMGNMGAGQPPMGNMGAGPPQMGNINAGKPPMGSMGAGQPPMGSMGAGQPPMGSMGAGQPPMGSMGAGQPPMGSMGAGQPPMGNMGAGQPPMGNLGSMGPGPPQLGNMGIGQPQMANLGQLGNMGIGQPQLGNMQQLGNMGIPQLNMTKLQPQEKEPEHKEESKIPPELAALAAEWTTHRAPDGRNYYYHSRRHESVWEKPDALKELEEYQAKLAAEQAGEKPEEKPSKMDVDERKPDGQVIDVEAHAAVAEAAAREAVERARQERQRAEAEAQREKERLEKEKEEKAKMDGSRPMWSTHVAGTPWRVVWTAEGRVFFFNPSVPRSVWARPEELLGREDVDKLISQPPEHLAKLQGTNATPPAAATTKASDKNGELKRAADSESDDSDEEPVKKQQKVEDSKKAVPTASIDAGKEAAIEAEVRAARERAIVPLEQRMKTFRQMLLENEVSAFSTWKKELHKIVFDKRYLLLTSDQRKQVFSKYVRERAEEERKEKMNRLQQKKDAFTDLLKEAKLHAKSSYIDFSSKYGKDDRFKGIDKPRNREQYFTEYLADLKKREKEEKEKKREQVRTEFISLLKEKSIDRHARWADAKKKVDSDPRYKAVDSSSLREDYFREYCKIVKEERKKEKEKEKEKDKDKDRDRSSSKKDKKDKEREKDRDKERDKDRDKERDKDRKERKSRKEKESDPDTSTEVEPPAATERATDEEGEATERETDEDSAEARERQARAEASIKEREKEVQRALANSLRDRDKERQYHKRDEAVQHFNALLADLVRNPDLAWREAKKQLKKDHRYNLAELLSKDDKERLFTAHIGTLATRRRTAFRALLTSLGVSPTAAWRDVRRQLRDEPRATQYQDSDKMEREFRDFQRDRQSSAKTALRQLLQETRSITHRSHTLVQENPEALLAVHNDLKHDARYTALDHLTDERAQIIVSYLEELHKKGPPPPPTATEPSRRAVKHA